ncbi:MAG: hypothetical protein LBM65_02240 [Oscillospiraceae bacterium]|nr:hypothetical protein [Oscillospiraceae bacterium]
MLKAKRIVAAVIALTFAICLLCSCKSTENSLPSAIYAGNKLYYTFSKDDFSESTKQLDEKVIVKDNWFADSLLSSLSEGLAKAKNLSEEEALKEIFNGGYKIYATVNPNIQNAAEKVFADSATFEQREGYPYAQSAAVIMDYSGRVLAVTGGGDGDRTLNRATRITRQPGSAIKPLTVYSRAVMDNSINYSSLIFNKPLIIQSLNGATPWPKYDDTVGAEVTTVQALARSVNTCAVQVAQNYTAEDTVEFLQNDLGFSTIVTNQSENDLSLSATALGYLTKGAYLYELCAAYQMFGNGGKYFEPIFYTKIEDRNGNVIINKTQKENIVLDSQTATIMNRLLKEVIESDEGTGKPAELKGIEAFGKTGTTTDKHFVGGTPEYLGAVYTGYDDGTDVSVGYTKSPTLIWKKIFEELELTKTTFELDNSVITKKFCSASGGLATNKCTKTEIGYYKTTALPTICALHK